MKGIRKSIFVSIIALVCILSFWGNYMITSKKAHRVQNNKQNVHNIEPADKSENSENEEMNQNEIPENTFVTEEQGILNPEGDTLGERFLAPNGYTKEEYAEGSFGAFVRGYSMKKDGAKVHLYNGRKKFDQSSNAAVFAMPLGERDLQQCADSVIRIYAEYFYDKQQYDKMSFHFVNGFECSFAKWVEGYRVVINGNDVSWKKSAKRDDSKETFEKYLNTVFSYASTLSLNEECEEVDFDDVRVGDVFITAGSPGHVVLVVDVATNEQGEKAVLLAQGYMPAQEFHVIKNPRHKDDPWYYEQELESPFETADYTFDNGCVKRPQYNA